MPTLDVNDTSKSIAILGSAVLCDLSSYKHRLSFVIHRGYIVLIGLVSYLIKNRLFISEAMLALALGIVVGPLVLDWFSPLRWSGNDFESLTRLTYQVTRLIIGIQVLFAGIDLPKAYLRKEWKSLAVLLGPTMLAAWFVSGLLIWGMIPGLTYLESLVIASCITPTDPVLANSICKGRFAEKHVPLHVRNIIVAESGANDGLGYPFLYMALYLVLRHSSGYEHSLGKTIGTWFYEIILYEIVLSVVIGAVIGYLFRRLLRFAEHKDLVDHDNFLAFGVGLSFLVLGIVGMIGSDDILCCFVAGNAFTWDDWFRVETEEHAVQDVIDLLLNSAVFLYIGAIMPWSHFGNFWQISPWRLVVLGLLVILLRRPPWVLAMTRFIPVLRTYREGAFTGYFGCIGVSAVFYCCVALEHIPTERERLREVIEPVVYFLVLTSVIVHGITIPIGKGFHHTLTVTMSTGNNSTAAVLRLPKAPTALPTDTIDEHDDEISAGSQTQADPSQEDVRVPERLSDGIAVHFQDDAQEMAEAIKLDQRQVRRSKVHLPKPT